MSDPQKPDPDRVDEEAAAQKLADEGIEGGHADVEKFPQSVMTEDLGRKGSTGDPTLGADADEYADSDVYRQTDDDEHQEAQQKAAEQKEEPSG